MAEWKIRILITVVAIGSGFLGTALITTGVIGGESDDLMSRLGWEPTEFVVTKVTTDQICGVLEGDDDVTCLPREKVYNDSKEAFGFSAVQLHPGSYFCATRLKIYGEEGIILRVPM